MNVDEFIEALPFSEEKKEIYRQAHASNNFGRPLRSVCKMVKGFIKLEGYGDFKYPRWINSRVAEFKVFCGGFFKAIETVVYTVMSVFIKHVPVAERPALISNLDSHKWKKYNTDWTSMEQHFRARVMEALEFPLYRHMLRNMSQSDVNFCLSVLSGTNHIISRGGIHARVKATRMSGEMNTSLGNGWSNYIVFKYICEVMHGGKCEGYVEGDDGIFASSVVITTEDYASLGFDVKVQELDSACEASFCGIISASDGTLVKDPRRVFRTFGWTSSFIHAGPLIMRELGLAKSYSLLAEAGQCPILGVLAREGVKEYGGVIPRWVSDGFHDTQWIQETAERVGSFNPSPQARELFSKVFGISPNAQVICERAIQDRDMMLVAEIIPPTQSDYDYTVNYVDIG